MKPILTTLAATLCLSLNASAAITSINSIPSSVGIAFDDSNSLNPSLSPGALHTPGLLSPYAGGLYSTPPYLDVTTLDMGEGQIDAAVSSGIYSFNVPLATLDHRVGNTGFAKLQLTATVEFQNNSVPFASPILFPTFSISGTVQPGGGGYAFLAGNISYTSLALGLLDTVTYHYQSNTPGAFTASLSGTPGNPGFLYTLPAFDTLTLVANFTLQADPANISVTTVPEPSSAVLALLSLPLLLVRRRVKARA